MVTDAREANEYQDGRLDVLEEIVGRLLKTHPTARADLREIGRVLESTDGSSNDTPFLRGARYTLASVRSEAGLLP